MKKMWGIALVACLAACGPQPVMPDFPEDEVLQLPVPEGFPAIEYPLDNEPTMLRVELGRKLFFDKRLSENEQLSCASCHHPELAFSDGEARSIGFEGQLTMRNSPSLVNVAWQERLFAEGGVPTLELQVLAPIDAHDEFNTDLVSIQARLEGDESLKHLAKKAYGREEIDLYIITRSIAAFERTLVGGDSKYDRFLRGEENLNEEEELGYAIFTSEETQCASCHSGFLLSNGDFHNIGLYEEYEDGGRERITNDLADRGKFKTPSLRNVAITSPYMHDGSIATLSDVVEHFSSGGVNHPNKDGRVVPLALTAEEKAALKAFLKTLTDEQYL